MDTKINKKVAKRILETVDQGLVSGLGVQEPGKMCIEAAVCFALGLPHGDNPPCVGSAVRGFKISLNDSKWPSEKERARGMRKLAVAQLGSDEIDQGKFLNVLGFKCMTKVLPIIVKNAIKEDAKNAYVKKHVDLISLKDRVKELESAKTFESAKKCSEKIRDIYYASASASASSYASASASSYASASASASSYASASASSYASASASVNSKFHFKILKLLAQMGLEVLVELKSPGCKFLPLCK